MYKLIASLLVVGAILFAWYVVQDNSSVPVSKSNDGGINLNR